MTAWERAQARRAVGECAGVLLVLLLLVAAFGLAGMFGAGA